MLTKIAKTCLLQLSVLSALVMLEILTVAVILPSRATAHESAPSEISLSRVSAEAVSVHVSLQFQLTHEHAGVASDTSDPDETRASEKTGTRLADTLSIRADGRAVELTVVRTEPAEDGRQAVVLSASLPVGTSQISVSPGSVIGDSIVRYASGTTQAAPRFVTAGSSTTIFLAPRPDQVPVTTVVSDYLRAGFVHIVPKGLDHILFIVGLFLLTLRLRPLLTQVSLFTAAHTVTLLAGASGFILVPAAIVEPLIAASIVFIAAENIATKDISRWRPFVVFAFGLLHGLGFAGVMAEFGLPENHFVAGLIAFNLGVELGQIFVLAICFSVVGFWFSHKKWYRRVISIPASVLVAATGAIWTIQRIGEFL